MFPIVYPKTAVRDAIFIFNFINRKTQCTIFLSIEQENIHTQTIIWVGDHILFDISFANKPETDSNI